MRIITENILRFLLLVIVQVLFLNNLQFTFCTPYIYILFILSLPVSCPRWLDLIAGFVLGLTIDMFSNTLGLHTFACVLIAYLRYFAIKLFVSEENRITNIPSFHSFGVMPYVKYVVLLTVIHHSALLALETMTFVNWWITLLRIVISSAVSIAIIIALQFLKRN